MTATNICSDFGGFMCGPPLVAPSTWYGQIALRIR